MAKIVRNKATGQLGCVLIEINEKRWDVVCEDGSYEQYSPEELVAIGETSLLRIPPPHRRPRRPNRRLSHLPWPR